MPPWIERVVQKIEPFGEWEQLNLPDESMSSLRRISDEMQERIDDSRSKNGSKSKGRPRTGVVAVFTGPRTQDKIRAAQVLAKELRMHLFRIDLTLVVSEKVEETERILKRLLDGADETGGVLFLDDGDGLFGKDSSGADVDNGIGYLLKRIGRYEDLAILSITSKDDMDLVHQRKLRATVHFPG
ncbi:MAG TPA: AAA family ATPase [Actinomycetota bacterium]|nr:AAA family ATPase [Actinomycetota bacterium]